MKQETRSQSEMAKRIWIQKDISKGSQRFVHWKGGEILDEKLDLHSKK
jgi:hypothetical protein